MNRTIECMISEFRNKHPDVFPEVEISFDECEEWEVYIGRLEPYGQILETGAMYSACSASLELALDLVIEKISAKC